MKIALLFCKLAMPHLFFSFFFLIASFSPAECSDNHVAPPVLEQIDTKIVFAGKPLTFVANATSDAGQNLQFSLMPFLAYLFCGQEVILLKLFTTI